MRAAIAFVLTLALTACQTTMDNAEPVSALKAITRSATANPGSKPISAQRATQVFTELCVQQRAGFSGTEASAAANGFVQNSRTGTYYHRRENLSVKLIRGKCSMVFVSKVPFRTLSQAFKTLKTDGRPIQFAPDTILSNVIYYRAVIGPRKN